MALFSRGKKSVPTEPEAPSPKAEPAVQAEPGVESAVETEPGVEAAVQAEPGVEAEAVVESEPPTASQRAQAQAEASVGISVSAFRGVGAPAQGAPSPAAEAPASTEAVPGLRDNAPLRAALSALSTPPTSQEVLHVARQLLQGQVFLRVKGDARTQLAEGKDLALAIATQGEAQYVLLYSGGEALQQSVRADGVTDTTAVAQPSLTVLRRMLGGTYAGVIIDHSSAPARVVLPRDLVQKAVDDTGKATAIKSLLAGRRAADTAAQIVAVLTDAPLWIAANRQGEGQPIGIAESRSAEGERFLEVFTHPIEVVALGRGDQPVPITPAQLAAALRADEDLKGLLVDPAGPWIRLTRDDLAPVIALAG